MISFLPPLQLPHTEAALRDANSSTAEARWVAALALGQESDARQDEALSALGRLINDSSAEVRAQAVEALAEQGRRGALIELQTLQSLQTKLDDESSYVRVSAIDALADLSEDAATILAGRLDDPSADVRGAIVEILGRLNDGSLAETLAPCLQDQEQTVRNEAALALGRLGDFSGESQLVELLFDEETLAREAAIVLGRYPRPNAKEALAQLATRFFGTPELKALASVALAGYKDDQTGQALLQSFLKSFKRRNRLAALAALFEVPRAGFVSDVTVLLGAKSDIVASSALLVLGELAKVLPSEVSSIKTSLSQHTKQLQARFPEELAELEEALN